MDWMQVLTIVAATVGSTYGFYMITERRIDKLDAILIRIEDKWDEKFVRMEEKFVKMDEKWEHLFERLLIQDKK